MGKAFSKFAHGRAETVVCRSLKNFFIADAFCQPWRASKITKGDIKIVNNSNPTNEYLKNSRFSECWTFKRDDNQNNKIVGNNNSPK